MKNIYRSLISIFLIVLLTIPINSIYAGNKDRSGQAGAGELLINPWARSSGWGGVNTANVRGVEGMFINIAGAAFTKGTELVFTQTQWLKGSEINISNFGFTQQLGETGVLGISVMSMDFGDIELTTVNLPDGGIGYFSPKYLNIGLSYSKAFSNSIYGGFNLKIISESMSDVSAQGVAIDVGIQYVTGPEDNIKFGVTLRNWGPTMKFTGDGLSIRGFLPGQESQFTLNQRSDDFELPSQLNIGFAYDFNFKGDSRLTLAGNFNSNSFTKDQFSLGAEFSLKSYLILRGGYTYEEGIYKDIEDIDRTNCTKGPSAGFSVQVPLNKEKGTCFSVDYSYRATDHFNGTHTIGARINL